LLERQGGECCVDGCHETEGLNAEHSIPNFLRFPKPDQLMCGACHKNNSQRDMKTISKAKRLSGATMSQYERRKNFGSALKGRPFQKQGDNMVGRPRFPARTRSISGRPSRPPNEPRCAGHCLSDDDRSAVYPRTTRHVDAPWA